MVLILDFYVDEPACFGVPPYLSPYCRYAAGALVAAGIAPETIHYLTVDEWRAREKTLALDYELILLITGTTVPGKYLGGKIGTASEVLELLDIQRRADRGGTILIGGPIRHASPELRQKIRDRGGWLIRGDIELYAERVARHPLGIRAGVKQIFEEARHEAFPLKRTYADVDRYAPRGAFLTTLHPNNPYLINELETYRGCTRNVYCSFCTEAFYGRPGFREIEGILDEAAELHRMGNRYFRLGRQADLLTYQADMSDVSASFPRPRPDRLLSLYEGLHRAAPELRLLHLDNINPGVVATFPEESRRILEIICQHNTPGDTAAMGLESADPDVIRANDLKCTPDQAMRAIEIINECGRHGTAAAASGGAIPAGPSDHDARSGPAGPAGPVGGPQTVPQLLPGLNFIQGLIGETEHTFEKNYLFLRQVLDRGLLLRRINIRQATSYRHTKLDRSRPAEKRHRARQSPLEKRFLYYRDRIRSEIDHELLKRNFPAGTILREIILENENPGYILGRPLGSYPVTVKIPKDDRRAVSAQQERHPIDVVVTGWEERSVRALRYPVDPAQLGLKALESLPGMGRRQAADLFLRMGRGEATERELADAVSFSHAIS